MCKSILNFETPNKDGKIFYAASVSKVTSPQSCDQWSDAWKKGVLDHKPNSEKISKHNLNEERKPRNERKISCNQSSAWDKSSEAKGIDHGAELSKVLNEKTVNSFEP